jgi:hypothetical protein
LGFFTPILKGFLTEMGLEVCQPGHAGVWRPRLHAKSTAWSKLPAMPASATLYEGTTGIQALDLLGRKVLLSTKGKCVRDYHDEEMLKLWRQAASAWIA